MDNLSFAYCFALHLSCTWSQLGLDVQTTYLFLVTTKLILSDNNVVTVTTLNSLLNSLYVCYGSVGKDASLPRQQDMKYRAPHKTCMPTSTCLLKRSIKIELQNIKQVATESKLMKEKFSQCMCWLPSSGTGVLTSQGDKAAKHEGHTEWVANTRTQTHGWMVLESPWVILCNEAEYGVSETVQL